MEISCNPNGKSCRKGRKPGPLDNSRQLAPASPVSFPTYCRSTNYWKSNGDRFSFSSVQSVAFFFVFCSIRYNNNDIVAKNWRYKNPRKTRTRTVLGRWRPRQTTRNCRFIDRWASSIPFWSFNTSFLRKLSSPRNAFLLLRLPPFFLFNQSPSLTSLKSYRPTFLSPIWMNRTLAHSFWSIPFSKVSFPFRKQNQM